MNKLSIPMLVTAAGMAFSAGCAEWRDDRADSGYRSIDQDARADRGDLRTTGTSSTYSRDTNYGRGAAAGESPDFYGSSPWSPANRGVSGDQAGGYTTAGATPGYSATPGSQGYPNSGYSSSGYSSSGAARTPDGRVTTGSTSASGTTQDARGSSPYSPANRGDAAGTGRADTTRTDTTRSDTTRSDTTRSTDDWSRDGRTMTDRDSRSTTGDTTTGRTTTGSTTTGTTATSGTTGTTQDPRGSSPYSPANRGDTTAPERAAADRSGQMTGREQDTRYTNPNTQDQRGSSPYSPANRGDTGTGSASGTSSTGATTGAGTTGATGAAAARSTDTRYDSRSDTRSDNRFDTRSDTRFDTRSDASADTRSGTRYDNRDIGTDTTDARAGHDTDWRTTSRDAGLTATPDFYGSSPWSPANRGLRVSEYNGPDSRPVARDIAWRTGDNNTATADRRTGRDMNNRDMNNRGMNNAAAARSDSRGAESASASRMHSSTGYSEGAPGSGATDNAENAAIASRPGEPPSTVNPAQGQPMDAIGVAPDARILSILHAKNLEEVELGRLAQNKGASAEVRAYGQMLIQDHGQNDDEVQRLAQAHDVKLMDAEQVKQMLKREKGQRRDQDGYLDRHQRNQQTGQPEQPDQLHNQDAYRDATPADKDADRADDRADDRDQPGVIRDRQPDKDPAGKDKMDKADHMAHLQTLSGSEFDQAFSDMMLKGHRDLIRIVEDSREHVTNQEIRGFLDQTLESLRKHEREAERLTSVAR